MLASQVSRLANWRAFPLHNEVSQVLRKAGTWQGIGSSRQQAQRAGAQSGSCRPKGPPFPANGGRELCPPDTASPWCNAIAHCLLSGVHYPRGRRIFSLKGERRPIFFYCLRAAFWVLQPKRKEKEKKNLELFFKCSGSWQTPKCLLPKCFFPSFLNLGCLSRAMQSICF